MGLCVRNLNAAVLGIAATIYLVLGLVFIAASAATFFTAYGQIFTPIYAVSGMGAGIVIFLISVVGYLAACRQKSCWLGLYMTFDLIIVALMIIAVILMFRYEDVLSLASQANVEGAVKGGLTSLSDFETNIVKDVVTNAFTACAGNTTVKNATEDSYNFACSVEAFSTLGVAVNACLDTPFRLNATVGSTMHDCYDSGNWATTTPLNAPYEVPEVLPILQTPKGLYCACASVITDDFILKYIGVVKYVGIGVAVFFLLIFVSCCYLCCCAAKEPKQQDANDGARIEFTPGGWSAGGGGGYSTKQKGSKYGGGDSAYIAKP